MTTGRAAACTHTERRRRTHALTHSLTHSLGGTLQHAVLLVSIRALGDTYPGRALGEAHGMHLVDYIGKLRSDAARCARSGYNMRANIPHSLQTRFVRGAHASPPTSATVACAMLTCG